MTSLAFSFQRLGQLGPVAALTAFDLHELPGK
jgi:hypothetical protein